MTCDRTVLLSLQSVCVCVCVSVCARERVSERVRARERERERERCMTTDFAKSTEAPLPV